MDMAGVGNLVGLVRWRDVGHGHGVVAHRHGWALEGGSGVRVARVLRYVLNTRERRDRDGLLQSDGVVERFVGEVLLRLGGQRVRRGD